MTAGEQVIARARELGGVSEEPGLLVRPYGGEAMRRANALVGDWMRRAGMEVRTDAIGNLVGTYAGDGPGTLVLASHLDTVRDAGRFDGPLGVLVAIACIERLHQRGENLPWSVEVVGFADEEGLRFGTTYLGSAAYAGRLEARLLELADADGIKLADAVRAFGGDPDAALAQKPRTDLLGYCEVHIEQGPVLERRDLPVGVVTAIAGQSRIAVAFDGEAGHAGTVPMELRRDALCAAAEFVLAAEATARGEDGLVATVGHLDALPGAGNVIPGRVELSLDVRHQDDAVRARARDALHAHAQEIAGRRGVGFRWSVRQESSAVPTDPRLRSWLEEACEGATRTVLRLPSGAGHDAAELAHVCPMAMLFVRCAGGISHNPAESADAADVTVAIDVLEGFLRRAGAEGLAPATSVVRGPGASDRRQRPSGRVTRPSP